MAVSPKVFRVATYHFACLLSTIQSHFGGYIGDGNIGTLKKNWLRTFRIRAYRNIFFCMKEYSALHKCFNTINYISQATKWNYFEVSTHVPT